MDISHLTPAAIQEQSFSIIDEEFGEKKPFTQRLWEIARRCIHASGDPSIAFDLRLSEDALRGGLDALKSGCMIYTDTEMARAGLAMEKLRSFGCQSESLMHLPQIALKAQEKACTRARAGIYEIAPHLSGAVIAIGNAPTALLTLLECLEQGSPAPSLIIGMPVGFVNAAESKALLHASEWPHFTLLGRKGGSALAAACVNAMAYML